MAVIDAGVAPPATGKPMLDVPPPVQVELPATSMRAPAPLRWSQKLSEPEKSTVPPLETEMRLA